ncbi:4'-phosphopantetheinyl transferase superfamily protein [Variovorax sp. J22R24]|uniref:4'-phosphopantetheinyl transferase family protein n=1 Tax=Variovorax gracilis TaxID=3053502 RepID=UPI00257527D7|nr:4'-phosphopantetheinyl transferase superfamily protein [Variovorax sp. J22R24]MDM0105326.1 4'-phosphopantetheinyl transferase superfamily protein [Variovorax sp. J22R24]
MTISQLPASSSHWRLWQVDLDSTPAPQAVAALSEAEWERARRFVFKRDRNRFVAAHAALRETLSAQCGIPASMLDFALGPFGKPTLAEDIGLRFNLSHSQSLALIAVCENAEVGVDIELLRPMPDAWALADNHFSAAERRALAALPPEERDRGFLCCWTRKEACLKATGLGLSVDTRSFEVGVLPNVREVKIDSEDGIVYLTLSSFLGVQGALCAVAHVLDREAIPVPSRLRVNNEMFA